jgi:hypothetical protein
MTQMEVLLTLDEVSRFNHIPLGHPSMQLFALVAGHFNLFLMFLSI